MSGPIWLTERDVCQLVTLEEIIEAVETAFRLEARGDALPLAKTHAAWGDRRTVHALGGVIESSGVVGTKTWANTPDGSQPVLSLWSADDGSLAAVIEAFALGQLRTAAVSAVATRYLAADDAVTAAIIGSGKQAFMQTAAITMSAPIEEVRVYSPNPANRDAFVDRLSGSDLFVTATACSNLTQAVHEAHIVVLATRAREPFLHGDMLARGTHVNAVGAITPERQEFHQDVFERCHRLVADSVAAARNLSSELMQYFAAHPERADDLAPLSEVVASERRREPTEDLTLFKAMGIGTADVAIAVEVWRRAAQANVGRPLPRSVQTEPRVRVRTAMSLEDADA